MRSSSATLRAFCWLSVLTVLMLSLPGSAQAQTANSDPTYVALKNIAAGNEALLMENVELRREFATFTFRNGTLYFAAPVNGKVTGAVFFGEGSLVISPKAAMEQHNLSFLTRGQKFEETFDNLVLRFTDNTYDELKKLAPAAKNATETKRASDKLAENLHTLYSNKYTRYNLSARILQDLLATTSSGLFIAFIDGRKYSGKEVFTVDPQGERMYGLSPEEVAFSTYNENNWASWAVSHLEKELANNTARGSEYRLPFHITNQNLDTELTKSAELRGTAISTVTAARDGVRVVSMNLFRHFEIDSVTDEAGNPLSFVFDPPSWVITEWDDPDAYSVILPKPLAAGEKFTFKTVYHGRDAVRNEGKGNYYLVSDAREDWFPHTGPGDYTNYQMKFRIPKGMKIAATGTLLSEKTEGDWNVSEWKSDVPILFAGFNFGRFKNKEFKLNDGSIIASYANEEPPDWVQRIQHTVRGDWESGPHKFGDAPKYVPMGTMDTTSMMERPLAEAQGSIQLYSDYFGPIAFKRLSVTQQVPCNYGQAWPSLVWLPICSFFDRTVRHTFGIDDDLEPYWSIVAPHEVAHEWWGHTVGWSSYRDQWISEGFAEFSAALFAQGFYTKEPELYHKIWRTQQKYLQEKNQFGIRPIDVGPLTMGRRVSFEKAPEAYQRLAYGKGPFIVHMLRMLMWERGTGDKRFKEMMQDFVKTYANRSASTEDFKQIVEKHMTSAMNLGGDGTMDWFFDEWVYGTELPKYDFTYDFSQENGATILHFKLVQSGVSDKFKMSVPLYLEMPNGSVGRLGAITVFGNNTVDQKVALGNINPKKAIINYNYDVLSALN